MVYENHINKKYKAILIHCMTEVEDFTQYAADEGVSLLQTYCENIEVIPMKFKIHRVSSKTYLTQGRLDKIKQYIDEQEAKPDFIFWNHNISHRHQKALEEEFKLPVYDRIKIILEIFADRAASAEEKLQVALAYKQYQRSRVTHAWSHLERQRGGLSKTGGPGEKQLELDKRMIDDAIKTYKSKLAKISTSREVRRSKRMSIPMVAIVGYTNVGKTTLFNLLTKSKDLAEDKLFATLNPHTRKAFLQQTGAILVSDTVGFIRNFPASLKNAFASTLEEVKYASLILHVHSAAMPCEEKYSQEVINILHQVGADEIPVIHVWNKCDTYDIDIDTESNDNLDIVKISCKTGYGIDLLKNMIEERIVEAQLNIKTSDDSQVNMTDIDDMEPNVEANDV